MYKMNKVFLASFAFLSSLMIMEGCSTVKTSQNSGNIVRSKTMNLFNGKNLDGWYTFLQNRGRDNDPKRVFTVHDGLIHISGEEWGCITTKEEYGNYKLVIEFKWGTQTYVPRIDNARDNGVLIHSTGVDGGASGIWMHSIESNIIEGGMGDLLVVGDGSDKFALTSTVAPKKPGSGNVFKPGGESLTIHEGRIDWFARDPNWKDVKGFRGKNDIEKPVGEWNRMECIAEGDKISIILNGTLVSQAQNVKPSKGRIQIQSEGAEIFYRRIDLTPLNTK
jgi:hypothetical protein